jgi:hypothetical protein
MAINLVPTSTSAIKSIQRGVASASGDITISSVNTATTTLNFFSTGASGTVAITGTVTAPTGVTDNVAVTGGTMVGYGYSAGAGSLSQTYVPRYYSAYSPRYGSYSGYTTQLVNLSGSAMTLYASGKTINAAAVTMNSQTITGGSTSLVAATNGAYLKDSTTITVTGPCRYEVIEYY